MGRRGKRQCLVPECDQWRQGHGLCKTHWWRAYRRGILDQYSASDEKAEGLERVLPVRDPICTEPGCNDRHIARGLCGRHYQQVRRADLQTRPGPICSEPGCEGRRYSLGLCSSHYHRARRALYPKTPKPKVENPVRRREVVAACMAPECDRKSFSHGLCRIHYRRAEDNDALDLFQPKPEETAPPVPRRRLTPDQVREVDAAARKARRDFMSGVITRRQLDDELEACKCRLRAYQAS